MIITVVDAFSVCHSHPITHRRLSMHVDDNPLWSHWSIMSMWLFSFLFKNKKGRSVYAGLGLGTLLLFTGRSSCPGVSAVFMTRWDWIETFERLAHYLMRIWLTVKILSLVSPRSFADWMGREEGCSMMIKLRLVRFMHYWFWDNKVYLQTSNDAGKSVVAGWDKQTKTLDLAHILEEAFFLTKLCLWVVDVVRRDEMEVRPQTAITQMRFDVSCTWAWTRPLVEEWKTGEDLRFEGCLEIES